MKKVIGRSLLIVTFPTVFDVEPEDKLIEKENLPTASQPAINEKLKSLNPDVRQRIVYSATEVFKFYKCVFISTFLSITVFKVLGNI